MIPSSNVGGTGADDLVHQGATGTMGAGNIGLGMFYGYPNPSDQLTVGGDLCLNPLNSAGTERRILGRTFDGVLSLYSATKQNDGTAVRLYGVNHHTSPGVVELVANNPGSNGTDAGHLFNTYFRPTDQLFTRMVITRNGLTGIGDNVLVSTLNLADRLTVNANVCLLADKDTDPRTLRTRSNGGLLNLMSGSDQTDGSGIQLFARTHVLPYSGAIRFGCTVPSNDEVRAFDFGMFSPNPTGAFSSFFVMNKAGNARFGPDVPFGERLTVDGDVYLYDATASNMRSMRAHTLTGGINIQANGTNTDGAALSVYGTNHAAYPGQVQLTSVGSAGTGFAFTTNSTGTFTDKMRLDKNGLLHLSNNMQFDLMAAPAFRFIRGMTNTGALYFESNDGPDHGTSIELYGSNAPGTPGEMHFVVNGTSSTPGYVFYNYDATTNFWKGLMNIKKDGKVVIGNYPAMTTPGSYTLYVDSGIMTERVNVALKNTSAWADYVFAPDYKLMPLAQVATYIAKNKHLPDVPAADEVVAQGIDMAKMDATLLKKIEELTLYTIELQKIIEQQGKAIAQLQSHSK